MSGKRRRLPANAIVKGADFNALMDLVEANQNMRVGPGLQMHRTSAGTFISQMSRGPQDGQQQRGQDPGAGIGSTLSFPAVVLDSLGWQDNSTDPSAMPPAMKYCWRYLLHMCSFTDVKERCMVPDDASFALSGPEGYFYRMPWDINGGGWLFLRDHEYYWSGGMTLNGMNLRNWAFNLTEQYNNGLASFPQGNGIDIKALQSNNPNLNIQPVPIGTIVMVTALPWLQGQGWFFQYENGIDGACGA